MRFVPGLMHALRILWIEPMVYTRLDIGFSDSKHGPIISQHFALRSLVFERLSDRLEQVVLHLAG
jgi:hypothetical protein